MSNWIGPAVNCLVITKPLIRFEGKDEELFDLVISYWKKANESRSQPRELIRWFGDGLARFLDLPPYIKDVEIEAGTSAYGVWVKNALLEAVAIANVNKIAVTFGSGGAVFR
jgi:hypothetical protein